MTTDKLLQKRNGVYRILNTATRCKNMSTGKTLIDLSLVNSPENCSEEIDKLTYEISSIMRE